MKHTSQKILGAPSINCNIFQVPKIFQRPIKIKNMAINFISTRDIITDRLLNEDVGTLSSIVYGTPITSTNDYPSKTERAKAALQMKNTYQIDNVILNLMKNEKTDRVAANNNDSVTTIVAMYNATGDAIKFVTDHNWNGRMKGSYPKVIENGQWGVFVHKKRASVSEGSKAAIVYRVKNEKGVECDWMCAWDNPKDTTKSSYHAYTEIRELGHFVSTIWGEIKVRLSKSGSQCSDTYNGCISNVNYPGGLVDYTALISLQTHSTG